MDSFFGVLSSNGDRPALMTSDNDRGFTVDRNGKDTRTRKLELKHEGPHAVTPWGAMLAAFFGCLFLTALWTVAFGNAIKLDRPCDPVCSVYADAVCQSYGCLVGVAGDTENCTEYGCQVYKDKVCTTYGSHEAGFPDYITNIHHLAAIMFFGVFLIHYTVGFFGLAELDVMEAVQELFQSWWLRDHVFAWITTLFVCIAIMAGAMLGTLSGGLILGKTSPLELFDDVAVDYRAGYSACGHNFGGAALSRFAIHNEGALVVILILADFLRSYGYSISRTMTTWAVDHDYNFYLVNAVGGIARAFIWVGIFYCFASYIGVSGNWSRDLSTMILTKWKNGTNLENWGLFIGIAPVGRLVAVAFTTMVTAVIKNANDNLAKHSKAL
jgi:hypothetical protein